MFKTNKYSQWYSDITVNAKDRNIAGYTERHHIVPRCMGGSDDESNLVNLTAREHFICHLLLTKMVSDEYLEKIVYAAWQQSRPANKRNPGRGQFKIGSRTYALLREAMAKAKTGTKRPPFSQEWKDNMKAGAKSRRKVEYSADRLAKLAANRKPVAGWNKGLTMNLTTEEREAIGKRMAEAHKGKPKNRVCCMNCKTEVAVNTFPIWHGDKCSQVTYQVK
jgi:hypothetical protein